MYCNHCGKLNDKDALYCKECGFKLLKEDQINQEQKHKDKTQKVKTKTKQKTINKTKYKTKDKKQKNKTTKNKNKEIKKGMTPTQKLLMFILFIMVFSLTGIIFLGGYIYHKQDQIKVPNLINMTYEQSELILAKKDLNIKKIETETQDQTKDNIVLKQNKKPGTKTRKNKTIKVYIGKYTKTYITEDYTGKNINEVMSILDNNNIKYEIKYKETNDYENYIVISQSPKEGKTITNKDTITITVAKNKEIPNQNNNQSDTQDNQNKQEPSQSEKNNNTNGSRISGRE